MRLLFAIVVAVLLASGEALLAAEKIKTVIAYTTISTNYSPLWIAKEMGFLDKHGIDADAIFIRGATVATQGLVSGGVSFIYAGGAAAVEAALSGADIVIVSSPTNRMDQLLVTSKDIQTPAQLKGSKIAVNSVSGTAILAVKIILNELGVNPEKDITYLALGDPPSRLAALKSGLVDGTVLIPPFTLAARKAGFNLFDDLPALRELEYPSGSLIVRREFAKREGQTVERVTRAMIEALHFFKTNKQATLRILKKHLRLENADELEEAYQVFAPRFRERPYPTVKSIKNILEWSRHPKAKSADPNSLVDTRFVEKLDKEGFIKAVYKK